MIDNTYADWTCLETLLTMDLLNWAWVVAGKEQMTRMSDKPPEAS